VQAISGSRPDLRLNLRNMASKRVITGSYRSRLQGLETAESLDGWASAGKNETCGSKQGIKDTWLVRRPSAQQFKKAKNESQTNLETVVQPDGQEIEARRMRNMLEQTNQLVRAGRKLDKAS